MILKSRQSLSYLMMSLLLVGSFVPFTAALAAVPSASTHLVPLSGAQSLSRLQAELPKGFKPFYLSTSARRYDRPAMFLVLRAFWHIAGAAAQALKYSAQSCPYAKQTAIG